jgi:hypothetical protein
MAGNFFPRMTTIGPILAVVLAAAWIAYTVKQSQLNTENLTAGVLTELAAADQAGDDRLVDKLLERSWSGVKPAADKTAINEPIILALLEVQIELHRILGDSLRSEVPVVADDPACQVDIIEQQLVWVYGASLATTDGTNTNGATGALSRLARQVACISGLQAAVLDTAMTSSFNTVSLRLQERNLEQLVPYLARFIAPLQLIILDARKHVGVQSAAWRWFNRWNPVLTKQVTYAGWATDRVYLWDRRFAVLAGFAPCSAGTIQPYCVDVGILLNTISEGKTLGRGDCSFAGMIAATAFWTENGERYICALNFCSDRKRSVPKTAVTDAQMTSVQALWPGLIEDDDRKLLRDLCLPTRVDPQSAYHDPSYCMEQLYGSRADNPFNQHLACLSPGMLAEKTDDQWQLVSDFDLLGVPQNPGCEILTRDTSQNLPPIEGCGNGTACLDFSGRLKRAPETASQDGSGRLADVELASTLLNPRDQGTAGLCDNPSGCVTQCTAISQQIARQGSCGLRLDPDDGSASPLTVPAEQLADPLLLTSWNQSNHIFREDDPPMEESFRSCSVGSLNEARPAARCGLLVCADGAPAIGVNSACSCRTEFRGNFTRELMCKKLLCADGQPADENCRCFEPDFRSLQPPIRPNASAPVSVE